MHTLDYMSLFAMYTLIELCETEEKMFYAKLKPTLNQCPRSNVLVLGDLNAVTDTDRIGYKICISPHASGTRNYNSYLFSSSWI